MAIAARQQTFIDAMMKWFVEVRLHVKMAAVAKLRFGRLHQLHLNFRRVNGMTVGAAHIVPEMLGAQEICVLLAKFMAA